ncbi:hypothetical protein L7F22_022735 [Adiantum nelumboides]|nr:hypothetical protein [Adiantum nelumboides]
MSAVLAKPQVKDFLKTLAKGKEKGQEQKKEHDVNAHAVTAEGEPSKKPWEEDIPELSSPSYSPPTSFSYSSDSSSSSNPRRRSKKTKRNQPKKSHHSSKKRRHRHARKKKTFKAGDKDIKFKVYNGKRVTNKALVFIRQFEVAFVEGHFSERSKLRHVSMYLKDTASDWWLTLILEKNHPRTWEEFKKVFYCQFLPSEFQKDVKKEWDRLSQKEHETVSTYIDRLSQLLQQKAYIRREDLISRRASSTKQRLEPIPFKEKGDKWPGHINWAAATRSSGGASLGGSVGQACSVKKCFKTNHKDISRNVHTNTGRIVEKYRGKERLKTAYEVNKIGIRDDHVPAIQVECKVRKHWKVVDEATLDGGARVNIMLETLRNT